MLVVCGLRSRDVVLITLKHFRVLFELFVQPRVCLCCLLQCCCIQATTLHKVWITIQTGTVPIFFIVIIESLHRS